MIRKASQIVNNYGLSAVYIEGNSGLDFSFLQRTELLNLLASEKHKPMNRRKKELHAEAVIAAAC